VLELQKSNLKLPLKAAAEYLVDDEFVRLFQSHDLFTLIDNYVWVKMYYSNSALQFYSIFFDLQVAGYTLVLTDPKRYLFYHNNFNEYLKRKRAGYLFQLNLLTVLVCYAAPITKITEQLLPKGMSTYVGSAVHHDRYITTLEQKVTLKDLALLKEALANNQLFKLK